MYESIRRRWMFCVNDCTNVANYLHRLAPATLGTGNIITLLLLILYFKFINGKFFFVFYLSGTSSNKFVRRKMPVNSVP